MAEDIFSWLVYDKPQNQMFCSICKQAGKKNSFTPGCIHFRKSSVTLTDHADTHDYQAALEVPDRRRDAQISAENLVSNKEKAVAVVVKTRHWVVKESIPISKYPSLMATLKDLDVPNVHELHSSSTSS